MFTLSLFAAVLIGAILGLLGGGGSTLTVPVLVYILGFQPKTAIALSLAIVGSTSFIGALNHYKRGNVVWKIIWPFGLSSICGAIVGVELSRLVSGQVQLIIFAVVLILSSILMFKGGVKPEKDHHKHELSIGVLTLIIFQGLLVGCLTGLIGMGGGFMIVPALYLVVGLSMRQAIGSSLVIIVMNTFTGFYRYFDHIEIPWVFMGVFVFFTILGTFVGAHYSARIPQRKLKKGFALFLICMGVFVLLKNADIIWSLVQKYNSENSETDISSSFFVNPHSLEVFKASSSDRF